VDSALQKELRKRIEAFVADLEGLVREAALQAVADALGVGGVATAKRATRAPKRAPSKRAEQPKAASKRIRRSAEDLERVASAIFDYVAKNPGKRAEEIKSALQIPTASWALPVKKLVDEGRLVARGAKRSTTYVAKP
jgi:hypothetical protein